MYIWEKLFQFKGNILCKGFEGGINFIYCKYNKVGSVIKEK